MKKIAGTDGMTSWNIVETSRPQKRVLKDGREKLMRARRKVLGTVHAPTAEVAMVVYTKNHDLQAGVYDYSAEKVS